MDTSLIQGLNGLVGMAIGALVEMGVEATANRAKHRESVVRLLSKIGLRADPPPSDFNTAYVYALIDFGIGKPEPVLDLFREETVQAAFRRAFESGDLTAVTEEVHSLLDWNRIGDDFRAMDVDPEYLIEQFAESFQSVVDRTRTVFDTRLDQKVDSIRLTTELDSRMLTDVYSMVSDLHGNYKVDQENRAEKLAAERVFDARIEQARELVNRSKPETAREILSEIEREIEKLQVSDGLRYRLATATAHSLLNSGKDAEASQYLLDALCLDPKSPKAMANASLGYLLRGDLVTARAFASRALSLESDQVTAVSVYLQASHALGSFELVDQSMILCAERYTDTRRTLAIILSERRDYEEAIRLHRQTLESSSAETQDKALFAQVLLAATQERWQAIHPFPWNIPADDRSRLEEARDLLNQAVSDWSLNENRKRFHSALLLRSSAYGLLGLPQEALDDAQRVLREDPDNQTALLNGGLAALQIGRYGDAVGHLARLWPNDPQVAVPLAGAYLNLQRYNDALAVLNRQDEIGSEADNLIQRMVMKAHALFELGSHKQVAEVRNQLHAMSDQDAEVHEGLGLIARNSGDLRKAKAHLNQALELADPIAQSLIALELGDVLYALGEFQDAATAYELMLDTDVDTPPTRRYVVALFNSGQRQKAHTVAKKLRDIYGALPVVSEIEAQVVEVTGDLDTAHAIYTELNRIEPSNSRHGLRASLVDVRRGRLHEAARNLGNPLVRFAQDPQALMSSAQVLALANQPSSMVLEAAYQARRLARQDPEIQFAYAMLFFSLEHKDDALSVEAVGVGTSVRLEAHREQPRWITILHETSSILERNEAGPDDPLARKLLGLRVGDHVVLREDSFDETEYTVAELQSKYVRAFQEVLEDFPLRFPDHHGVHRVHVAEGDITPVLSVSEEYFRRVEFVQRAYDNREIPLGVFARLIGRSPSEVWIGRVQQESGIYAASGSHSEQAAHRQLLGDIDAVAVDLTCLLTLRLLDRLDLLKRRFTHIFVAQALKDQLFEDIGRQKQFSRKYGILLRHEGRYMFQEVPAEVTERQTRFLEDVYAFVNEACTVVPLPELLTLSHTTSEQIEESIGLEPVASVLVAKEKNVVLYCDDAVLRQMAVQVYGVQGVWTRAVIQDSFDRGLLAPEQCHEAIAGLVWANYHFVQLNIDTLKHVLQANQWVVTRSTTKVFHQLSGPVTTEQSAVQVLAMLIKDVWLEPIPYSQKTAILDMCLSVLTTERVAILVLSLFEREIMKLFKIMSFQQDQVLAEMKIWSKAQALTRQTPALLGR